MKLMRLPFVGKGTASGTLLIRCRKCGKTMTYGEASEAGWGADLDGRPYADYVCKECQTVRIRVRPGNYGWTRADTVPGLGSMEMGPLETEAVPLGNGKYAIVLPDGKKVFVEGEEIEGEDD
jgi:hypothetical protein